MATALCSAPIHNRPTTNYLCCKFATESSSFGFKFPRKYFSLTMVKPISMPSEQRQFAVSSSVSQPSQAFDVVIVGAGIIGLSIARQFLIESDLSVAVVDRAVPCSGATGAGQGYLWMVNKTPGSEKWDFAMRSQKLWKILAESLYDQGLNPLTELGWKKTGSLLVGRTQAELDLLKARGKALSEARVEALYLSSSDLVEREPALFVGEDIGAVFVAGDCQLDARLATSFIIEANRRFISQGRYAEFFNDPVRCLIRSIDSGEVVGVETSNKTLYGRKAIIVAAGCWTGSLMHDVVRHLGVELAVPVKPRKGHLLVVQNFNSLQLNHGLMEMGYVDHEAFKTLPADSTAELANQGRSLSVSMTATLDTSGNLLLGSSREFAGFNTEVDETIISSIWDKALDFFPKLRELSLPDIRKNIEVRVGLRPYMSDGKPLIGPVPGLPNLFLAAGHGGEGLSLALGTAEMIVDMVLGRSLKINANPFSVEGRCCK